MESMCKLTSGGDSIREFVVASCDEWCDRFPVGAMKSEHEVNVGSECNE